SPFASQAVRVRGVVTRHSRKGYFVHDPKRSPDPFCSDARFVYSPRRKARVRSCVAVMGPPLDFARGENGPRTTQLQVLEAKELGGGAPSIGPVWLSAEVLPRDAASLARYLNGLEGVLVGLVAGSTFVAPSNPFGDYVCVPPGVEALRAENGGVLIDPSHPH